jgi:mutator protein MutT
MKKKARALVIVDDSILLIRRTKGNEVYYVFPGGSVEDGETFEQACIRELQEELGITVRVTRLVTELVNNDSLLHENFYEVEIVSGEIGTGMEPKFSSAEYVIEYIPISRLPELNVLPSAVRNIVHAATAQN